MNVLSKLNFYLINEKDSEEITDKDYHDLLVDLIGILEKTLKKNSDLPKKEKSETEKALKTLKELNDIFKEKKKFTDGHKELITMLTKIMIKQASVPKLEESQIFSKYKYLDEDSEAEAEARGNDEFMKSLKSTTKRGAKIGLIVGGVVGLAIGGPVIAALGAVVAAAEYGLVGLTVGAIHGAIKKSKIKKEYYESVSGKDIKKAIDNSNKPKNKEKEDSDEKLSKKEIESEVSTSNTQDADKACTELIDTFSKIKSPSKEEREILKKLQGMKEFHDANGIYTFGQAKAIFNISRVSNFAK